VSGVAPMRYPLEPLFKLTGWTMRQVSIASGTSKPNSIEYRTRLERGVTALVADRLAIAAGLHPAEIWPSWWDDTPPEAPGKPCEECGGEFTPRSKVHVCCSDECGDRRKGREWRRNRYATDPDYRAAELARVRAYKAVYRERLAAARRAARRAESVTDKGKKNVNTSARTSGNGGFAAPSSIAPQRVPDSLAS
jgi:lambda repressor-like predicted transcriptional regulator